MALGQSLGAFEDPASGAVDRTLTGEQKLQRSPAVRDYLLERITVSQAGPALPGPSLGTLEQSAGVTAPGSPSTARDRSTDVDDHGRRAHRPQQAYRTMLTADCR